MGHQNLLKKPAAVSTATTKRAADNSPHGSSFLRLACLTGGALLLGG